MQVCKRANVNDVAKHRRRQASTAGTLSMLFRRHKQRVRQRGTTARVRFSPQLRKPRQSDISHLEVDARQSSTTTPLNDKLRYIPNLTNASASPSRNLDSAQSHPRNSTRKGAPVKLSNGNRDFFPFSPRSRARSSPSQECNSQNCLSPWQNVRPTTDSISSLTPQNEAACSGPAASHSKPHIFLMDFVSAYFSRTPRSNAHAATTPGYRRKNSSKSTGSVYWDEGQKTVEYGRRPEDVQEVEESSPSSILCQKLREVRKPNFQKANDSNAPKREPGFEVAVRPGCVHFLAPTTEDIDSLQTITLTPKALTPLPHAPQSVSHPVSAYKRTPMEKGYIIRKTSCESAASSEAKKDKGFNLFGFWNSRPGPSP